MNRLRWCTRRGSSRTLIAALLLAGVFAMHGLTGNHDAAMAVGPQLPGFPATQSTLGAVSPESGRPQAVTPAGAHSAGHEHTGHSATAGASRYAESQLKLTTRPDDHGHVHTMDDVCLAMLAALLLALLVTLARGSLAMAHPVQPLAAPVLTVAEDPSPPWCRPALSKLCILRT